MKNYRDFATTLAKEAGSIIKTNFSIGMKTEWKQDDSPLTITDTTINKLVIERIQKQFPDHAIIGEEESLGNGGKSTWVCDPLDGTVPFSHGYPTSVFALAYLEDGKPLLGILYDPMMDRMVIGERGKGAFLNDKKISVSDQTTISHKSLIQIDCDKKLVGIREQLLKTTNCYSPVLYSASYAGLLIACGEFVGEVYEYSSPWDGAAQKIIIEEAGGKVTDLAGDEQRYDAKINGLIATNGKIHKELLEIVKKFTSQNQ